MTLGAFVLGMMLSASDLRYQIDASVDLFKQTLMGLFFIAVGMSIDVSAVLVDWRALLMHVPIILLIKVSTLIALALAFGASREAAVFVTSQETDRAKKLAITLHSLYPNLDVYVRVDTIAEQDELTAKGISHAGTGYIESTLTRGAALLQDLGLSQDDLNGLLEALRRDNYAMIRSSFKQLPAK